MSKETALEPSDILEFMALRSPKDVGTTQKQIHYIHDRTLVGKGMEVDVVPTPLLSTHSPSMIARTLYRAVFLENRDIADPDLLGFVPMVLAELPDGDPWSAGYLLFADVGDRAVFDFRSAWYLVPDRTADMGGGVELLMELHATLRAMGPGLTLARAKAAALAALHQPSLRQGVLAPAGDFAINLWDLWRRLFDRLYLLYSLRKVLRRRAVVRHDEVIAAMQALHLLETFAVDDLVTAFAGRTEASLSDTEREMLALARRLRPALRDWTLSRQVQPLLVARDAATVQALLRAKPAIHPVFSRGLRHRRPFSAVNPIGVGDLKVVRQRLVAYKPGEISYIHNVMMGENRERKFRRLEKSEDTFSSSTERSEERQSEHQATDRFELKRDAEQTLKQTIGITANGSVTYDSKPVVATVTAGFSFQSAAEESAKTAETLAREVIAKSVDRVSLRASEQRTSVRLLETEETNTQGFNAEDATQHVSGIYRWVDKVYEAQLWNVGRRMMFEFIVPEPAHFLVESRLRAYAQDTPLPEPPVLDLKSVVMPLALTGPDDITLPDYEKLALLYDLSALPPPERPQTRRGFFSDATTGEKTITGSFAVGIDDPNSGQRRFRTRAFTSRLGLEGYRLTGLRVDAFIKFHEANEADPGGSNNFQIFVDGIQVLTRSPGEPMWQVVGQDVDVTATSVPLHEEVEVTIGLTDAILYSFTLGYTATRADDGMADWRRRVYQHVHAIERARVEDANRRLQAQYDADLAAYQAEMAEFRARTANDILQGRSGLLNARVIVEELKKHCITLMAKEFDSYIYDDRLLYPAVATRPGENSYYVFKETPSPAGTPQRLKVEINTETGLNLPAIDLNVANNKAPLVQFLEQAFEWNNLAYLFYPYFWGAAPRWIEMMNRFDAGDPFYTAFLQAGSSRVLLAATPGYEDAVLHYLATGVPWEGGPSPVIDDPLFLPLHEEIRKQQQAGTDGEPEGDPWPFILPTSLVYLQDSSSPLPEFDEPPPVS
ncbi:hypothetical protein [Arenimonas terrae]|uniref:Uncharacterized protein n=1 Tax=Arenimonas terrae TaxID=2546226 RepID=A0A5C4RQ92_9GAMM|nr:hypothetical protein [Arenimonas terrae]TNJ32911.1 hypothetical protein E1B00_14465 [Arenimonas terrae]